MPTGIYIRTEKHRESMRGIKKPGVTLSNQIRIVTKKTRHLMSLVHTGAKNGVWKGGLVGYRSLHEWVERWLGKATKCMNDLTHKSTRYHWANISKEYKRDLSDWIQLCPSCNGKDRIGRRVSP